MSKSVFYGGILYQIEYHPELSSMDYTQKHVYHIKTDNNNFHHAREAIRKIMNDGSWSKFKYRLINRTVPSMENALHTYHEFEYNEELDVYVYTFIRPYDD